MMTGYEGDRARFPERERKSSRAMENRCPNLDAFCPRQGLTAIDIIADVNQLINNQNIHNLAAVVYTFLSAGIWAGIAAAR